MSISGKYFSLATKKLDDAFDSASLEKVEFFLKGGADPNIVLFESVLKDKDTVQLLLDYGANPDHRTVEGETVLMYACLNGRLDIVKLLLKKGAKVNATNSKNETALLYACSGHEKPAIVKLLLENDADPDIKSSDDNSALYTSVDLNHLDVTKLLLKYGANPNITFEDESVLFHAIPNTEIVKMLLKAGSDPNIKSSEHGNTPLIFATINTNVEIAELLIHFGADPNTKNDDGNSALIFAVQTSLEISKLLLKYVDPNIPGNSGNTPLMFASFKGIYEAVELLLSKGANPLIVNDFGENSITMANENRYTDIVNLLITYRFRNRPVLSTTAGAAFKPKIKLKSNKKKSRK